MTASREKFETWFNREWPNNTLTWYAEHGRYAYVGHAQVAWEAYQAGLAAYRATQPENTAREPHDGWMNAWIYENTQHDQNASFLWSDIVRKMAGDWADFRLSHQYRATQEEDAGKMGAKHWYKEIMVRGPLRDFITAEIGRTTVEYGQKRIFEICEAYHQYRASQDERSKANPFYYPKEGDPQ